ncbi:MAG: hypothetical protein EOL87_08295 [Spartobacteria bacterium]|nr:hypothetical protein [Spartobacteria bacterium]
MPPDDVRVTGNGEVNQVLHADSKHDMELSNLVAARDVQQDTIRLNAQDNTLMVGLLCMMTGSVQQDEIAIALQKVHSLGREALGASP